MVHSGQKAFWLIIFKTFVLWIREKKNYGKNEYCCEFWTFNIVMNNVEVANEIVGDHIEVDYKFLLFIDL